MLDFIYDKKIDDKANEIGISVTVVDTCSDSVLITLHTGRVRIPFFVGFDVATRLAGMLTNAVCAYDREIEKAAEVP